VLEANFHLERIGGSRKSREGKKAFVVCRRSANVSGRLILYVNLRLLNDSSAAVSDGTCERPHNRLRPRALQRNRGNQRDADI
jgi:hypothetical protein